MKIDVIYTFDGQPQQRATYPFVPIILSSKKNFIDFLVADLDAKERGCLIKISTCILSHLQYPISRNKNHWFNKCAGKIWIDDLEKYRKSRGWQSNVSKDYINDFFTSNKIPAY